MKPITGIILAGYRALRHKMFWKLIWPGITRAPFIEHFFGMFKVIRPGDRIYISGVESQPFTVLGRLSMSPEYSLEYAVMTGRNIVIMEPGLSKYFLDRLDYLKKPDNMKKYLDSLASVIQRRSVEGLDKIFAEEYVHWYSIRGTSVATLIEGLSLGLRFQQIALAEVLHKGVGYPRKLQERGKNHGQAVMAVERYAGKIKKECRNFASILRSYLSNLLLLHKYVAREVELFVEPVTWACLPLGAEELEARFKRFQYYENSYVKDIFEKTQEALQRREVFEVLEDARRAINIPSKVLNTHIEERVGLAMLFKCRYVQILQGAVVETAANTRYIDAILCMLTHIDEKTPKIASEVLMRNERISDFIYRLFTRYAESDVYELPSIYILTEKGFIYLDPLTGITQAGGLIPIRTLEDLVGDLPLTLRGFTLNTFTAVYLGRDRLREEFLKRKALVETAGLSVDAVANVFADAIDYFEWDMSSLTKLLDGAMDEELQARYISSWLYVLERLGRCSTIVLGGLHGIY